MKAIFLVLLLYSSNGAQELFSKGPIRLIIINFRGYFAYMYKILVWYLICS